MNEIHLTFLASPEWARMLETDLLPWVESVGPLGDDVLEIGPGPGLTTDILRTHVPKLTAVEIDPSLAGALADRLSGTNVDVINADATASGLPSGRFTAATCFTMLHHVPTPALQDALFAEVFRVLRPGAMFIGTDSIDSEAIRMGHEGDVFVPVDPATVDRRLESAGFRNVDVGPSGYQFRFTARKPLA